MRVEPRSAEGWECWVMNPGKPHAPEGVLVARAADVTLCVRSAPRLFDPARRVSEAARRPCEPASQGRVRSWCKVGEPDSSHKTKPPMKQAKSPFLWAAADLGARELVVAITTHRNTPPRLQTYPNTPAGHRQFLKQLPAKARSVPVAMEATGVYGTTLALRLQAHAGVEVMVLNPRAVKDFIRAGMQRAKTDRV